MVSLMVRKDMVILLAFSLKIDSPTPSTRLLCCNIHPLFEARSFELICRAVTCPKVQSFTD